MLNKSWVLQRRPIGPLEAGDLALVESEIPDLREGEVLVRNVYLSIDPTNRIWMSEREQYMPPVEIGEVMRGGTLGVVTQSRSSRFSQGDVVMPFGAGWTQYVLASEHALRPMAALPGIPLNAFMSVLGGNGLTAYFGLLDVGRIKEGETVVISAAAGSVGSIAGQIAKIKGCRVIGIAGGPQKCAWLRELGFDGAIDYKNEDVAAALERLCPNGVDVSFENVGGSIMDAVYNHLNDFGRIALCGMISTYNNEGPAAGPKDFSRILMRKLTIQGFIVMDFLHRAPEAFAALGGWVSEGRIRWKTHIVDGIENAPEALSRLFSGDHDGKLLIRLSPEP